ncbi:MAG TPA: hypothetical protein VG165_01745 [Solirubrobacteraceae bacterium]|nr:hypothetical protein [Solirubrobacteraceae bacterium]
MSESLESPAAALLDFLAVSAGAPARSPIAARAARAGARMVVRNGFAVAGDLAGIDRERAWIAGTVGVRDASHLPIAELEGRAAELAMAELQGPVAELAGGLGPATSGPGIATYRDGGWWCRLHPGRLLVVGSSAGIRGALDVTSSLAGVRIEGPLARETIARFCALDLRDREAPVGAVRPGSIARTPGIVLREAADVFLLLFGWAYSDYVWDVAIDAAESLGGGGVGADA